MERTWGLVKIFAHTEKWAVRACFHSLDDSTRQLSSNSVIIKSTEFFTSLTKFDDMNQL